MQQAKSRFSAAAVRAMMKRQAKLLEKSDPKHPAEPTTRAVAQRAKLHIDGLEANILQAAAKGGYCYRVMALLPSEYEGRASGNPSIRSSDNVKGAAEKIVEWLKKRGFDSYLEFDMNVPASKTWYNLVVTW